MMQATKTVTAAELAMTLRIAWCQLNQAEALYVATKILTSSPAIAASWLRACVAHTQENPTIKVGTMEDEQRWAKADPLLAAVVAARHVAV